MSKRKKTQPKVHAFRCHGCGQLVPSEIAADQPVPEEIVVTCPACQRATRWCAPAAVEPPAEPEPEPEAAEDVAVEPNAKADDTADTKADDTTDHA